MPSNNTIEQRHQIILSSLKFISATTCGSPACLLWATSQFSHTMFVTVDELRRVVQLAHQNLFASIIRGMPRLPENTLSNCFSIFLSDLYAPGETILTGFKGWFCDLRIFTLIINVTFLLFTTRIMSKQRIYISIYRRWCLWLNYPM